MPIVSGTKLGPYQITGAIGAGGMGEVYQAQDTRLGRGVAIKVLPETFAHDPDRLSRFQREAKMLAALNHPNIATIYGLEQSGGTSYLVMELVPGETLAEKIKREGAIPPDEVLAIARQTAEALESAHEKGIVHRDLKPANIKVTPEGKVKVLDFGLAKALADDGSSQDMENSPTMTAAATMQGIILGTAGYMSPEQARGKPVDRRADIWAFGVVLHEMLTGRQLFGGETVTDALAQVITKEPEWDKIPLRLQRLLRWCLEKDPKKRLRDITDGMVLVDSAADSPLEPAKRGAFAAWPWAVAAAACVLAAGLGFILLRARQAPRPQPFRFTVRLPENVNFTLSASLAISPDGRRVAFPASGPEGRTTVWIQDLDGDRAWNIPGTDPPVDSPPFFWSPDSRYVAFPSSTKIRRVDVLTGSIQDICERPVLPIGGSWNREGVIIFGSTTSGIWRVSAEGGTAVPATVLDAARHDREHELPVFLPDGRHFIYFVKSTVPEESGIYAGSLDDPPERQNGKRLVATRFGAVYAPSDSGGPGHLLWFRDNMEVAQSFDPAKLELLGEPVPVAERVGSAYETPHFSTSPNILVFRGEAPLQQFQLTWYDREGKAAGKVGDPGAIFSLRLSPDATRLAFVKGDLTTFANDVWILNLKRNTTSRFTFGPGLVAYPVWSPDGREIIFSSNREGHYNLYRKPVDGSRSEQLLLRSNEETRALSWSQDGRFLLYSSTQNLSMEQIWVLPMQGEPKPMAFSDPRFDESNAQFSPDGRWVAYDSKASGGYEVYVREFNPSSLSPDSGGKWMVSKDGGTFPRWSGNGKEITYVSQDHASLMSLSVNTDRTFQPGPPKPLIKIPTNRSAVSVAMTPDLKRFLLPVALEIKVPQMFTVILNWTSQLKK